MICPHCKKDIDIETAQLNVEAYRRSSLVSCPLCRHGLVLSGHIVYTLQPYHGDRDEDDWGAPICT